MRLSWLVLGCLLYAACDIQFSNMGPPIDGEGPVVDRTLDYTDFSEVHLEVPAKLIVRQGDFKVVASGQANILDAIEFEKDGDRLEIELDNQLRDAEPVILEVTLPDLTGLSVGGSGDIEGTGTFAGLEDLELAIGGSGSISISCDAQTIEASIGGSGDIDINGSAEELDISIAGSGTVNAEGLTMQECSVSIAGSGDAYVGVSSSLDISIAGSGNVYYQGTPSVTSSTAGSGTIVKR